MANKRIVFVSSGGPEDASEELWSRTAVQLAKQGFSISASVAGWPPNQWRVENLKAAGIHVKSRATHYSFWKRGLHYVFARGKLKALTEIEEILRAESPGLVVFSSGWPYPPIEFIELCISENLPFVTIANGNRDDLWQDDAIAERYRKAFALARRCYFVSKANVRITEKQIGCELPNAEVVWSQYNVDFNSSLAWPAKLNEDLRLAAVGRLYPAHKGQDILLEALATPMWINRQWHLSLYGDGPMRNSLERLVARFGLSDRVTFAGHVAVEEIWSSNHVLVVPSRCEGGPLVTIEAMLCGRPVLGTDVGLNPEIIIDGLTGFLVEAPTVTAVTGGLERIWANRGNLENMGRAGAKRIRELVPADPIQVFSEKIKHFMD